MTKLLIQGARLIDPATHHDGPADILIDRGRIVAVESAIPANGAKTINAKGRLAVPGLVDLHTHLRQPGREDKETIATGLRAAARGGFTTICAMPNTEPAIDEPGVVEQVTQEAQRLGMGRVRVIGAVTRGRLGRELTNFGELFDAGCVALSDDGAPIVDSLLMRRALEYAKVFGRPLIQHAEDLALTAGGVVHEGLVSTTLGLRGIPSESESVIVSRDLGLAELTGSWIHFAHLSTAQAVEAVRQAKRRGVRVTCEVTPHHLALTHEIVEGFNTHAKVNPPLRTEADRQALIAGLRDGTIDCIATDHAPHTAWEKEAEFDAAPFGISGLETALGVCIKTLIEPKQLTWTQLIDKLSVQPAAIAGLSGGTLKPGTDADLTLIDPEQTWTVEPERFASKGHHSPFRGWTLPGVVTHVVVRGTEVPVS